MPLTVKPFTNNEGVLMVPAEVVSQSLNASIYFDSSAETATIGFEFKKFEVKAVQDKGVIFVPLKSTAELMGASFKWIPETNTVIVEQ